jgi:cell division protein FtsQ
MARRPATENTASDGNRNAIRFTVWTLAITVVVALLFFTASRVEQFLITDARFVLAEPPSDSFQLFGLFHTSEQQVMDAFARDFGRSLYLCPIAERRRQLLGIDWVKDATVSRVWPNVIVVRITERQPIAFAQIATASGAQVLFIDADGVLLNPEKVTKQNLPVLVGIPARDTENERRERVKRFVRMQQEAGPLLDKVSEIDVSDIENLKVALQYENEALTLLVGNQKYKQRLQTFFDHYSSIRSRLRGARVLDLRLEKHIVAVGGTRED